MFHYFEIDELKNAIPADYLISCTDDDGDNEADAGVLEWARQAGEYETDSALEASPRNYNPDDYQVDDDDDGISDNVPGIVKLTALLMAIKRIGSL